MPLVIRSKVTWNILPFVTVLFILSFLDRVNLSFAAIDMNHDLGFSPAVYGLGAGIFFWGYILFEVPAARLVERHSAPLWLGLMLIAWGIAAALMGTVQGETGLYTWRVILGIAEAGFFPGIIIYLSRWFPRADRARAIGALAIGLPAANLIGAPVSSWLLSQHWLGVPGWRWIFIVEGIPSVLAGICTIAWLKDRPRDAQWLTPSERTWLETTLANERAAGIAAKFPLRAFLTLPFVTLVIIWFLDNVGVYGFNLWLPTMIRKVSNYPSTMVVAISSTPFIGALIAAAAISSSSDRSGERRLHTAIPMVTFGCGLALSVVFSNNLWLSMAALCLGALGLTSGTPGFWALATGHSSRASATHVAILTTAGALGGLCGPYLMGYFRQLTGGFETGLTLLSTSVVIAGVLVLTRFPNPGSQSAL